MSNRRIAVGEHGAIAYARTPKGWVARTTYRGADGALRNRQASGRSKESAGQALHAVLTGPPKLAGEYVTGDSRIEQLAAAWLTEIRMADEVGPETYDYYRRGVQTLICADDGIGNYRINELRPMTVKQFYQRILTTTDSDGQRLRTPSRPPWAHTVLSQMLRYAVEIGALDESPVRDINPPKRGKNQIHVLSPETFHDIRQAIAEYDDRPMPGPRRSHQLLDIFDVLAGTGARISEALALRWIDVDLQANPVRITISGTLLPGRDGQPIRRKHGTKTPSGLRTIAVPDFTAQTFRRMYIEAGRPDPQAPVFETRNDTWMSPGNIRREWRQCRQEHDWLWVTPQTLRRTVATLIDHHYSNLDHGGTEGAGAPIAAAVLGHSSEAVTRAHYIQRMRQAPDASAVLNNAFVDEEAEAS